MMMMNTVRSLLAITVVLAVSSPGAAQNCTSSQNCEPWPACDGPGLAVEFVDVGRSLSGLNGATTDIAHLWGCHSGPPESTPTLRMGDFCGKTKTGDYPCPGNDTGEWPGGSSSGCQGTALTVESCTYTSTTSTTVATVEFSVSFYRENASNPTMFLGLESGGSTWTQQKNLPHSCDGFVTFDMTLLTVIPLYDAQLTIDNNPSPPPFQGVTGSTPGFHYTGETENPTVRFTAGTVEVFDEYGYSDGPVTCEFPSP